MTADGTTKRGGARGRRWIGALTALVALGAGVIAPRSNAAVERTPLDDARALIDGARRAVASGSVGGAVAAAAHLADVATPPLEQSRVRTAVEAVDLLLDAIARTEQLVAGAVDTHGLSPTPADVAALLPGVLATPPGVVPARVGALAASVDQRRLVAALAEVATAVDRALPALRAGAHEASRQARPSALSGCDLVDRLPLLCVGSTASNTYRRSAALLIDLGGDDVHEHGAGTAAPLVNGLSVSVTIDIAGNDRYGRPADGLEFAQGVGFAGGVGLLVDVAGDDRYGGVSVGQGFAFLGAGALVDLRGDDAYEIATAPVALLWGVGVQGVGVLADQGGNDRYRATVTAGALGGSVVAPNIVAGGVGLLGAGLAWDSGGTDDASIAVSTDEQRHEAGAAAAVAFGTSLFPGSVGASLWGDGPTRRHIAVHARGTTESAFLTAAGVAIFGTGALVDLGGNDITAFDVQATAQAARATTLAFGAAFVGTGVLDDDGGDDAHVVAVRVGDPRSAGSAASGATVLTHGAAFFPGGVAALRDLRGADRYATDVDIVGDLGPTSSILVMAQAAAIGAASAVLEDGGGSDRYVARLRAPTAPAGTLVGFQGAGAPVLLWPTPGTVPAGARLVDVDAGERDSFEATPAGPLCVGTRGARAWSDCRGGTGMALP